MVPVGVILPLLALLFVAVLPAVPVPVGALSEAQPALPSEGWYPTPEVVEDLRWWDGQRWTGATKPLERAEA